MKGKSLVQVVVTLAIIGVTAFGLITQLVGCNGSDTVKGQPVSISGIKEVRPEVTTGQDGMTNEQRNILFRLKNDNTPGSIKHLYLFSAYSGDCLLYSTVMGKVTSSGKRLSPTSVTAGANVINAGLQHYGIPVKIGGTTQYTTEVLQDDGTYGSSIDYLYWKDSKGIYHQQYISGGIWVHVSNEPIGVKKVIVNLETRAVDGK